jgi:FG-GAP-like repeat
LAGGGRVSNKDVGIRVPLRLLRCSMKSFAQLVFSLVLVLPIASAQMSFTDAAYSSGATATGSITSGDFTNDGILDLVTINAATLSFYRGLGGGKYAKAVKRSIPHGWGQVAAADLNLDAKLDLVIAQRPNTCSSTGNVTVLPGNGDGTFAQASSIGVGGAANYITLADFNGDHIPDLAVSLCEPASGSSKTSTKVFLGQGNGTFKLSSTLPYGAGQVVAGDFNADGHQDIAVIDPVNSELVIFRGNGNGTFKSPVLASVNTPFSLAVGDFYNDRIQSLALLTGIYNNSLTNFAYYVSAARYLNGSIVLSPEQLVSKPNSGTFWLRLSGGDLDGDFKDDIILVASQKFGDGALTASMLGNGDGSFKSAVSLPAHGQMEDFPFVRDLYRDSLHDIGTAWSDGYIVNGGGAFVLLNTKAVANCAPPKANALGINICAPYSGETVSKTFTFKASGNVFSGIPKRMELWVDGKKIGQNLEDQLKKTATLAAGKHTASFVVVDSFDHRVKRSVNFHVQ